MTITQAESIGVDGRRRIGLPRIVFWVVVALAGGAILVGVPVFGNTYQIYPDSLKSR